MSKKIEFIESYIHTDDGDYLFVDNHGQLIRCDKCKHCKTYYPTGEMVCCRITSRVFEVTARDYCSFAEEKS